MKRLIRPVLLVGAVLALVFSPSMGRAQGPVPPRIAELEDLWSHLPDIDTRTQVISPTAQQLNVVQQLGATASWTRFGTVKSLINYQGTLATGLNSDPKAQATSARQWILANRGLFRLSEQAVNNLELVNDAVLQDSTAHAVLFRQRFGNLTAVQDGMITVGLTDGTVVYATSSAIGDAPAPPAAKLTAVQGWLKAAANVGRTLNAGALTNLRQERGWTMFNAAGLAQTQQVRLRAFAVAPGNVRAVFEANVIHSFGGEAEAYTLFVDAVSGDILFRQNRVQHATDEASSADTSVYTVSGQAAPMTTAFSGSFTPPATCGVTGPYSPPAGATSITVVAAATIPTNDIVLNLRKNGTVVATADTATSPEEVTYTPSGGVTAGNYTVEVCPFADPTAPLIAPYTYQGAISFDVPGASASTTEYAKWKYFTSNPPLDYSDTDTRVIACWKLVNPSTSPKDCNKLLNTDVVPWDHVVQSDSSSQTTLGNSANSARSWGSPLTPSEQVRPTSPTREYVYPWVNEWYNQNCSPAAFTSVSQNDTDAAVTNLFTAHTRMHDWSKRLGFTELNWNAQVNNFGKNQDGQADPETGNTMAGAVSGGSPSYLGRDNANQITLQDGVAPISNMYLWQPIAGAFYAPCVDGDYDMSIVGHEYTHMISNRMVGGPDSSLTGHQAGSMGESWSDLTALEYLHEHNYAPIDTRSGYVVGAYATGNTTRGIRNFTNFSQNDNPLNYGNVGYDTTGPEVHADAEIWDATNHEVRRALIRKYNASYPYTDVIQQAKCSTNAEPAYHCPGNRRWMQLVFDAYLLMPPEVSMLDARNAMIAADQLRFVSSQNHPTCGGPCWTSNQVELWQAFAYRGMGVNASSNGSDDTDPKPNFETPLPAPAPQERSVTFSAKALNAGNKAIVAKIFVGDFEARSTPIADTDPATPLSNVVKFVPGSYKFVVQAAGYGMRRFTVTIAAGGSQSVSFGMATNWASSFSGADITTSNGVNTGDVNRDRNIANLIDDTESTNWARTGRAPSVAGAEVTVKLGGGAHTIAKVQVSALLHPADANDPEGDTTQGRFTALRRFRILACTASAANGNCTKPSGFTVIYTSLPYAFPGVAPRPTAPDQILRSFTIPASTASASATHVKFQVLSNQCTGNPAFQIDDADPTNDANCITGSDVDEIVHVAELQVFDQ